MNIILSGGGTGGHIYPAIAIADEIKKMKPGSNILFIGAYGKLEERIVPAAGYDIELINISGIERSSILANIILPFKLWKAMNKCTAVIREFKPDAVVGTGGYVSGPVVLTAMRKKIPLIIQEGNSFPGKVTKHASSKARKVIVNFIESVKYLKRKDNVLQIAHPIRTSLNRIDKAEALKEFGLSEAKTVFIFGGSQGAKAINDEMMEIAEKLHNEGINVIWQTGKNNFDELRNTFRKYSSIKVLPFIENMSAAYSASDIVVSRAGITSIMEMAHLGSACILIPLPTAAENHQEMNARSLYDKNAAVLLLQKDISSLYDIIITNLNDSQKLQELSSSIKAFADKDAAVKIAAEILKLAA